MGITIYPSGQDQWPSSSIFPSGTAMLFQQSSAPVGWTKQSTHDDKALRVVAGGVTAGGVNSFSSTFVNGLPTTGTALTTDTGGASTTGNTALSVDQLPPHQHKIFYMQNSTYDGVNNFFGAPGYSSTNNSFQLTSDGSAQGLQGNPHSHSTPAHSHTVSAHTHTMNLGVQYVDVIIATKD